MSKNIEAKAYCGDPDRARRICERLGARFVRRHRQRDTYFVVPHGRLKLRESDRLDPMLIHYDRLDMPAIRESSFTLVKLSPPVDELRNVLSKALGVRIVTDKQRDTYLMEGALVNLDTIAGLGEFLEIEVQVEGLGCEARAREHAGRLKREFEVEENDLIPWSYADLLAMYRQARMWRKRLAQTAGAGHLFLVDGPSGAGKTTASEALWRDSALRLKFVRRHCTRRPRSEQENEYVFVSPDKFRSMAACGDFLDFRDFEFGMSYGLAWKDALEPLLAGQNAVAIMNWGNARHIRRAFPEARLILSIASVETLRRRLVARGIHDDAQLAERLENAQRFSRNSSDYDLLVQNEDGRLDAAVEEIKQYVLANSAKVEASPYARR